MLAISFGGIVLKKIVMLGVLLVTTLTLAGCGKKYAGVTLSGSEYKEVQQYVKDSKKIVKGGNALIEDQTFEDATNVSKKMNSYLKKNANSSEKNYFKMTTSTIHDTFYNADFTQDALTETEREDIAESLTVMTNMEAKKLTDNNSDAKKLSGHLLKVIDPLSIEE